VAVASSVSVGLGVVDGVSVGPELGVEVSAGPGVSDMARVAVAEALAVPVAVEAEVGVAEGEGPTSGVGDEAYCTKANRVINTITAAQSRINIVVF